LKLDQAANALAINNQSSKDKTEESKVPEVKTEKD